MFQNVVHVVFHEYISALQMVLLVYVLGFKVLKDLTFLNFFVKLLAFLRNGLINLMFLSNFVSLMTRPMLTRRSSTPCNFVIQAINSRL